ncbi:MAG: single-stranded DNA-binding protein [Lachnospiraceae bacterium]|nr:single-stranded DNA-binding protein [Lachnospiraceae bacterium]
MNKVILMGRLTREPDIRYTQGEAYQGTNFNRKIASEFEGLFSYLPPEMPLFLALSGISLV